MNDEKLLSEREIAYSRLESELQLFWQRNNYAWLIFVGSITALGYVYLELINGATKEGDEALLRNVQLVLMIQVVSAVATLASALWLNMIKGGRYWVREWELKIVTIEKELSHNSDGELSGLYQERGNRAFYFPFRFLKENGKYKNPNSKAPRLLRSNIVSVTSTAYMIAMIAFYSLVVWSGWLAWSAFLNPWYSLGKQHLISNVVTTFQILVTMCSVLIVSGWSFSPKDLHR